MHLNTSKCLQVMFHALWGITLRVLIELDKRSSPVRKNYHFPAQYISWDPYAFLMASNKLICNSNYRQNIQHLYGTT